MAGKHEILPDEKTVFIAVVEEFIVFVNASAPTANHVAVAFREELENRYDAFRILRMESVGGNPVGADDADRLAVDFEAEPACSRNVDVASVQFDGAESRTDILLTDNATMPAELRMDVIKIGIAVTKWRPKLGVLDTESRMPEIRIDMVV